MRKPHRTILRVFDLEREVSISSDQLLKMGPDEYNAVRRGATEAHLAGSFRFVCERCGYAVYAPKEPSKRLPYWKHYNGAPDHCEWSTARPDSIDTVSGQQFQGQQESPLHERLKIALGKLLETDPLTEKATVVVDKYLLGELGSRRPDVRCKYDGQNLAFELQLSSTQLPIIVNREKFYEENGFKLLWLTWQFEERPFQDVRAAFQDIFYSHKKNLFSMDDETLRCSRENGSLRIRAHWIVDGVWRSEIVSLRDLTWPAAGLPFYKYEKQTRILEIVARWIQVQQSSSKRWQDQEAILLDLSDHLGLGFENHYQFVEEELTSLLDYIISIDVGRPIASDQKNLIELTNTFLSSSRRHKLAKIIRGVLIGSGKGDFLSRPSVRNKFDVALRVPQVGSDSIASKIVHVIYPEWT